jgi:hypothetical protein
MNEKLQFLRQRIEHEDNLINQRLSWLVGSQSFLITAFAISLNAPVQFYSQSYVAVHQKLLHLLPIVAVSSILVLMLTLFGAVSALTALRRNSDLITTAEDIPIHSTTTIRWLGLSAAFGIPMIFLVFWLVLIKTL